MKFEKVDYSSLNARQKESYNYQKLSAVFAEYGYSTILLNDDYNGADFLAIHCFRNEILKIQLKARLTYDSKYLINDDLLVCFPYKNNWYLYNHKEFSEKVLKVSPKLKETISWKNGKYTWISIKEEIINLLIKI